MFPPSEKPGPQENFEISGTAEFTEADRKDLLVLAHEAILSILERREISVSFDLQRYGTHRGAFTTIYLHNNLRGCVGYAFPTTPLYATIVETARGAAFDDPRFPPVNREEARQLDVSLSILSPLTAATPEEVTIGLHGLFVSQHGRRGLLLPQVPVEHGWDRITFLQQTCRKAGLPADAWQSGASVEVFTAEVFGDAKEK